MIFFKGKSMVWIWSLSLRGRHVQGGIVKIPLEKYFGKYPLSVVYITLTPSPAPHPHLQPQTHRASAFSALAHGPQPREPMPMGPQPRERMRLGPSLKIFPLLSRWV